MGSRSAFSGVYLYRGKLLVEKIGFIGLGVMGKPMACNLVAAGFEVYLFSRSGVPKDMLENRAHACSSVAEVARHSTMIFLMLPSTPDVEVVLFGTDGLLEHASANSLFVDMSTISPTATFEIADRVEALGCQFLDAPVSGGDVGARDASLSIMVGGSEAAFNRALPVLELMGSRITHLGKSGAGQVCKAANQIVVAMNIQAVAEALAFAREIGVDPVKVRAALLGGFAGSKVLEVHGQRMLEDNYQPGFTLELHQKDLGLVSESALSCGLSLPGAELVAELMRQVSNKETVKLDSSILYQQFGAKEI